MNNTPQITNPEVASTSDKTKNFLWKSANALKDDVEISKDLIHSLNEHSTARNPSNHNTCEKCGTIRNETNTTYRIKPKRQFSKGVDKAMKRRKAQNKKTKRILKKFVTSCSSLVIHCKNCSHYEKVAASNRTDIYKIRNEERQRQKSSKRKSDSSKSNKLLTSTPMNKRKSVESFINTSFNNKKKLTPLTTPKSKKKHSANLSKLLLSNESNESPNSSLTDFLTSL